MSVAAAAATELRCHFPTFKLPQCTSLAAASAAWPANVPAELQPRTPAPARRRARFLDSDSERDRSRKRKRSGAERRPARERERRGVCI